MGTGWGRDRYRETDRQADTQRERQNQTEGEGGRRINFFSNQIWFPKGPQF